MTGNYPRNGPHTRWTNISNIALSFDCIEDVLSAYKTNVRNSLVRLNRFPFPCWICWRWHKKCIPTAVCLAVTC